MLSHEFSPNWVGAHVGLLGAYFPSGTGQSDSIVFDHTLGLDRRWKSHALGPELRAGYFVRTAAYDGSTEVISARHQIILGGMLRWRWDLTDDWATELAGGVTGTGEVTGGRNRFWFPSGRLRLGYSRERGQAEFSASRTVRPNLFTAENFLTTEASLRGAIPLFGLNSRVWGATSTGIMRNELLNTDTGQKVGHADVWLVDAALRWLPIRELEIAVRYQHFQQVSSTPDLARLPSFTRNVAMVVVTGIFPAREMVMVPSGMPIRTDRADMTAGTPSPSRPRNNQPRPGSQPDGRTGE